MIRRRPALSLLLSVAVAGALATARAQDEPVPEPTPEPPASKPASAPAGITSVTLLFTSDIHGHYMPSLSLGKRGKRASDEVPKPVKVGGLSTIAAKVAELRKSGANVLVFDSGDVMSGHPVCDLEHAGARGGALFEMMNLVGYDAWEIGNHDFDHGRENTGKLVALAKFPTVCANMKIEGDAPKLDVKRWVVLERFGLKFGVFGLMTDGFAGVVGKEKVPGITVTSSREAAKEAVAALRPQCDIIIALTHTGHGADLGLAREVKGIDIILGGHDHRPAEPALVEGTIVAEAALKTLRLGRIDLDVKDKKIVGHTGHLLTLPFVEPEGALKKLMDDVHEAVGKALEEKIGDLATDWHRSGNGESNVGDFFCDALLAKTGVDVSFLNSGGIRTDVKAGPLTVGDVVEVFPIENELVTFELTGEQLQKALERNAAASVGHFHGILQVGGVRYKFEASGKRDAHVIEAECGGKPIDPKRVYKCVATDFVAIDQAEKYLAVAPSKTTKLGYGMQAVALEHARVAGAKGPIKTPVDGRIKQEK